MTSRPAEPLLCGDPYPGNRPAEKRDGGVVCVKPPGHDGQHTTLLGVHPAQEDGWGQMWPEQEEWAEWLPHCETCGIELTEDECEGRTGHDCPPGFMEVAK